jgi:hypothetical protein
MCGGEGGLFYQIFKKRLLVWKIGTGHKMSAYYERT